MHSLAVFLLLTIFSSTVFAGDYPVIGVALLQSAPQSDAFGAITITQQYDGASIVVEGVVFNLKPNNQFGFHVHEQGDLTNGCQSAGSHFNPYSKQHGSERSVERHWGDFGNIVSDNLGNAKVSINVPFGSLIGADGYIGRALVLHEREDDLGLNESELSKTTGDSGKRIACGVIGIRRPIDRLPIPQQTQWTPNNPRTLNFIPTFRQQQQQPPQGMRTVQSR